VSGSGEGTSAAGGAGASPEAAVPAGAGPGLPPGSLAGIFTLSLSILVLQVALTRLLSVVLWYHFAFVAISLAMLGLAVGGIALYLFPALLRATPRLVPWLCRASAVSSAIALVYSVGTPIDTVTSPTVFGGEVAAYYVVLLLPFLASGLAISAVLSYHSRSISTLYLFDLVGASLGCVLVVFLLSLVGAPASILAAAVGFCLAGAAFSRGALADRGFVALFLALFGWQLVLAPFEPDHMHGQPDADVEAGQEKILARWNSHSRIVVTETRPGFRQINIDGSATTGIHHVPEPVTTESTRRLLRWLPYYGGATPYSFLPENPSSLIIGPGGGIDILTGVYHGADVTAIELNGVIHGAMTEPPLDEWSGYVYTAPGVEVIHDEARSWIRRADRRFDLIQAMMIDTWAATSSGAFALAENAVYTVEAFEDLYDHLTPEGVVHYTRWNEATPRQSLRVLALITEALRRRGIEDPERYVVVLHEMSQGMDQASILWAKRPFSEEDLGELEAHMAFREANPLTKLVWPGDAYDNVLSTFVRTQDRQAFLDSYEWDVSPTTDDRPFFFNTMRLREVTSIDEHFVNEQAVGVLLTVLVTVSALVGVSFLLPFLFAYRRIRREGGSGTALRLLYFCGLGFGFMLLEIPALQRFGLYLGHPTYTLSTILTVLLLSAGTGSFVAGRLFADEPVRGARIALVGILIFIALLGTVVPGILHETLTWPLWMRILMTASLLGPLGILLGFPLPLGVRALGEGGRSLVPWAWGMNGATSVLASVLGVAIGMYAGFTMSTVVAGACYLVALATTASLGGAAGGESSPT